VGVGGTLRTGLVERIWGILWAGYPCRDEQGTSRDERGMTGMVGANTYQHPKGQTGILRVFSLSQ
jgi:hypothetical protein